MSLGILSSFESREFQQNCIKHNKDFKFFLKANSDRISYHWIDYYYTHWGIMLLRIIDTLLEPIHRYRWISMDIIVYLWIEPTHRYRWISIRYNSLSKPIYRWVLLSYEKHAIVPRSCSLQRLIRSWIRL